MCASSPPEKCDAAELGEAQVREHLLHLKDACGHSPSTIRTATAAFSLNVTPEVPLKSIAWSKAPSVPDRWITTGASVSSVGPPVWPRLSVAVRP